ncbi:MAG: outer membrane protein assembly factor BamB [Akkermansiaceae bacterium]|jgi:outer membrane protein assembly factor BamB
MKPLYLALLSLSTASSEMITEWRPHKSSIENQTLKASETPGFDTNGNLIFDNNQHLILPEESARKLPLDRFTVEARVRIDQAQTWGTIISYSQDNGSYERGWILGFNGNHFSFRLSTGGPLLEAAAPQSFEPGHWAHLLGTYDGQNIQLYVNGVLASSRTASGPIVLPDIPTPFVIGAYKDSDEFYPINGRISSIRILDSLPTQKELADIALKSAGISFSVRPAVRFLSPGKALLIWEASHPGKAIIAYGPTRKLGTFIESTSENLRHELLLENLQPHTRYSYRISSETDDGPKFSPIYEFDTGMNYMPAQLVAENDDATATSYLADLPAQPGFAVVVGLSDGTLTKALAAQSQLNVTAFDDDLDRVNKLRKKLTSEGLHGTRITLIHLPDLKKIPLTSCVGNLVCTERTTLPCPASELARLTRPNGGRTALPNGTMTARDPIPGAGEWTHQYGPPSNTTYTNERLGGAQSTEDLVLQWIGRPGANFGIDRQPRMSAPLAANGRLFHQGLNRLMTLDAYNGQILWGMEIPDLRRVNIPHDCANWCADDNHLYVAVKDLLWVLDAATGTRVTTLKLTADHRDSHEWGYIAQEGDAVIGSSVRLGAEFKKYFGDAWYDKVGRDSDTANVLSDNIFGYSKSTWKGHWSYSRGLVINATLSLAKGKLCFLETRDPDLKKDSSGRESTRNHWNNIFVVCLDATTGKVLWEKPFPKTLLRTEEKGFIQVSYGSMTSQGFLATLSEGDTNPEGKHNEKGIFSYHYFDLNDGALLFQSQTPWRTNHHGSHITHPVVYEDRVYTDPTGISLPDGKPLDHKYGPKTKCSATVGTSYGLLYRGLDVSLTFWSKDTKQQSHWPRLRPSCWLSALPAQGLFLVPEGGGGCSCGGWMETSLAFIPRINSGIPPTPQAPQPKNP